MTEFTQQEREEAKSQMGAMWKSHESGRLAGLEEVAITAIMQRNRLRLNLAHLLKLGYWDDFATDDGSEHPIVAQARQALKEME